jgi:hypothetical protein
MDVIRRSAFSGAHYLDCKADKKVNMEKLNATAFIVPIIALIIIFILYMHLLKHSNNRSVFKRVSYLIIAFSFLLNFAWEMLQMPLYEGMEPGIQTTLFCALAAVADALMVLLIYYAFGLIYKSPLWIKHLNYVRVILLILTGGLGAVLMELRHLDTGTWGYKQTMPLIPFVKVGVLPVLQFMSLPVLSYIISIYFIKKKSDVRI